MNRVGLFVGVWTLALAAGCGGRSRSDDRGSDGTDSHTHWLSQCSTHADCDDGLSCLCGACSASCTTESACDDLGAGALCVELSCERPSEGESATSLCSRGCDRDADCPGDGRCAEGVCVAGELAYGGGSEVPAGCEFLEDLREEPVCPDDAAQCEQMQRDGSTRVFDCVVLYSYEDAAGSATAIDQDEVARRVDCVARWFDDHGAKDPAQNESAARAVGTWEQVGALASVRGLECRASCVDLDCAYCYELDEAACLEDAFCSPGYGAPIDTEALCQEPSRFATCRPGHHGCDDALTTATDESGTCWAFGSICYDEGFDYSADDPACQVDLPPCSAE